MLRNAASSGKETAERRKISEFVGVFDTDDMEEPGIEAAERNDDSVEVSAEVSEAEESSGTDVLNEKTKKVIDTYGFSPEDILHQLYENEPQFVDRINMFMVRRSHSSTHPHSHRLIHSSTFDILNHTHTLHMKELLAEKDVSPFSSWQKELHKFAFDPRYERMFAQCHRFLSIFCLTWPVGW